MLIFWVFGQELVKFLGKALHVSFAIKDPSPDKRFFMYGNASDKWSYLKLEGTRTILVFQIVAAN